MVDDIMFKHKCVSSNHSADVDLPLNSDSSSTGSGWRGFLNGWLESSLAVRRVSAAFDWLSSLISRSGADQHLSEEIVTRRHGEGGDYSGPDGHLPEIEE